MKHPDSLPTEFYQRTADRVARDLVGRCLIRELGETRLVARIVETEAYLGASDRASHAWGGRRTQRNRSLYLPGGHAYVYLIYGIHHCFNVVTGDDTDGGAVLVRAGEPVQGSDAMAARRALGRPPRPGDLLGGPGKLCQALEIGREQDGLPLDRSELRISAGAPLPDGDIAVGRRVGIDYAGEAASWALRFALLGNPHVSRPRPW